MIHMDIPQDVAYILGKLRDAGFEAYAVGGCVRDSLLGRTPKDWDVTTSALPGEVKSVFGKTIDTGIKHGTVTVMVNGTGVEVTTYRIDGEYLDGRHPEEVLFTACLEEDLKRRDFTINAFVYNDNEGIKDLFNGLDDLKNKIIRCVGEPEERFGEDALRILRAVRFSAVLGFSIDPDTYRAAVKLAPNLKKVSAERIKTEIDKILLSENPDYIWMLKDMGISSVILNELDEIHEQNDVKSALKISKADLSVRWAVLMYFMNENIRKNLKDLFSGLKFDNKTSDKILLFLTAFDNIMKIVPSDKLFESNIDIGRNTDKKNEADGRRCMGRIMLSVVGKDNVLDYLNYLNAVSLNANKRKNEELLVEITDILQKKECYSLKMLALNGRDLLKENLAKGREVGEMLDYLLKMVLLAPEKNNREYLLNEARTYRNGKI